MFSHLHTGQVQQGAQEGGKERVIIPMRAEQRGEVKGADETFEAHIDMLL